MKKFLLVFVFGIIVFLFKANSSFAAPIYSNTFNKTSLSDFTTWPPPRLCDDSAGSLNGTPCVMKYTSILNNMVCVSADIDTTDNSRDVIFFSKPTDGIDNWAIAFAANNGARDIAIIVGFAGTTTSSINTPTGVHNYMFCKDNDTYRGYLDNNQVVNTTVLGLNIVNFSIGTDIDNNAASNPITNLLVTDSLPTTTPTSTPTPTPTPTPIQLSVNPLKQTNPQWGGITYDSANIWAAGSPTIGNWGCALTSATMVLNYYNIHKLPGNGNTLLTPSTLNGWLNTQPDGYIPNGNVNWQAIARLTKKAKVNNPTFPFDALYYTRSNFADSSTLLADLNTGHPDILEEPGHFIVATGNNGSAFTINDPYFSRTLLSDPAYNNTFLSLGRYIPSFTDLSYMLFTSDPSLTVTLKDSNSNPVGISYTQGPLSGAGTTLTAGNPINILYLQQPGNGTYTLTVSGSINQLYTLKGFLYDVNGNVKPFTLTGTVDPSNPNTTTLHFDSQNLTNDNNQKVVTISSFLNDLSDLYKLKYLKQGAYEPLKNLGKDVQNGIQKHNTLLVKIDLGIIKTLLGVDKNTKLLTDTAYQILLPDIQYLQSH